METNKSSMLLSARAVDLGKFTIPKETGNHFAISQSALEDFISVANSCVEFKPGDNVAHTPYHGWLVSWGCQLHWTKPKAELLILDGFDCDRILTRSQSNQTAGCVPARQLAASVSTPLGFLT
jgi:hypothetical protein